MKTIKTLIALVVLAAFAGCNSDNAPSDTSPDTNAPAAQGAAQGQLMDAAAPAPGQN